MDVQVGTAQVFSVSLYFSLCLSVCNHAASLCTSSRCLNSAFVSISSVSLTPYQALLWSSLIPPSSLLFDAFCRLTYMGHQSRVPNADDLPIVSLSLPLTLCLYFSLSLFLCLSLSLSGTTRMKTRRNSQWSYGSSGKRRAQGWGEELACPRPSGPPWPRCCRTRRSTSETRQRVPSLVSECVCLCVCLSVSLWVYAHLCSCVFERGEAEETKTETRESLLESCLWDRWAAYYTYVICWTIIRNQYLSMYCLDA